MTPGPVTQCAILIGGAGSRLGDLTRETPKPMLPIGRAPFLAHLLKKAALSGLTRIVLLAGFRADVVAHWLAESAIAERLGIQIDLSIEPEPMGTGGALLFARDRLDQTFLLVNGDTWFDFDWRSLADADLAPIVLGLKRLDLADRYETVELDDRRVCRIVARSGEKKAGLINGGAYRIDKAGLPSGLTSCSLESDILPHACRTGGLAGLEFEGAFIDIGLPSSYSAADKLFADDA